ncbi:MAG: transcriptional repressor [Bacillota bacterium]
MPPKLESFRDFLATRGGKLTNERKAVLKAILGFHDHFTADELFDSLRARGDKVSRASVYRALDLLVSSNLLRKLDLGENKGYYEQGFETHHHLVCASCNRVIEFAAELLLDLDGELRKRYQFSTAGFSQKITGLCHECSQTRNERGSEE